MKAILVINDMPKNCGLCEISNDWYDDGKKQGFCPITNIKCNFNERPDWCPLKPMPKRVGEISYDFAYGWSKTFDQFIESQTKIEWMAKGWNACIEELEK